MLDKETSQLINKARILGDTGLSVFLEDCELLRLCAVCAIDLEQYQLVSDITTLDELENGYYGTALEWFKLPVTHHVKFEEIFLSLKKNIPDFSTYFKTICELHKRRRKFQLILENQTIPKLEQIVPRSLLEFGLKPTEILASCEIGEFKCRIFKIWR